MTTMTTRDATPPTTPSEYMSKKVMINGQPVTLYSKNGLTWLSSPEEIPDVMSRLENTRVLLNDMKGDKEAKDGKEAKGEKGDKSDKVEKTEKASDAPAETDPALNGLPKAAAARYRMKGPKPRPHLKQDGVTVTGTPVAPISASTVQMTVGAEAAPAKAKAPAAKRIAPIAAKAAPKAGPKAADKLSKALSKVVAGVAGSAKKGNAKAAAPGVKAEKAKPAKAAAPKAAKVTKASKPAPKAKAAAKGKSKAAAKKK